MLCYTMLGALEPLARAGQRVSVQSVATSFAACKRCAFAFAAAVRTGGEAVAGGGVQEFAYLDSAELHRWLGDPEGEEWAAAPRAGERVLTLLLFDLSQRSLLLLDRSDAAPEPLRRISASSDARAAARRQHQAVPFGDMVVGVQSRAGAARLDAHCGGAALSVSTGDASRALLGAVLEAGWGVAPPHVSWSEALARPEVDLLWAVGAMPWGPYAHGAALSFAQRDAAARGALHARAAEVVREAALLRDYHRELGKEVDDALGSRELLVFTRRLNLLQHKLDRARTDLSLHAFDSAHYFLLSSRHDLRAMRALLAASTRALRSQLACQPPAGS